MATKTGRNRHTTPAREEITFSLANPAIQAVYAAEQELHDLAAASALQSWDQQTQMAIASNIVRGPQIATLQVLIHERQTTPALGAAIETAERELQANPGQFTVADQALVREARRSFQQSTCLPASFVREVATATSESWAAWMRAKAAKDFTLFAANLSHMVELAQQHAHYLNPTADPYAVLFELYEPGVSLSECAAALDRVRNATVPLLARIRQATQIDDAPLHGEFDDAHALQISRKLLEILGYQFANGRLDLAAHPFETSLGSPYDVRVTTRLDRHNVVRALLPAMHEGGHALYELGIDPTLSRSNLAHGTSHGIHESQSRFWENIVGRSEPFWQAHYHELQAVFPKPFKSLPYSDFVRALNRVAPDFIRVEADELTYNLHIIIRFELEQALIRGELAVKDLPAAWNQKYHDYLGVDPTDDAVGVLQDIHWSHGSFGYFASYTLGNLFAAQFAATIRTAFPDMDARLAKGETAFIREWQREQIHRWGKIWGANDLSRRVTGEPLNPDHFIRYVTQKFERLYGLNAE